MEKSTTPPYVTTRNKELSLWQSAVTHYVYKSLLKDNPALRSNSPEVFTHPMVTAVNLHVDAISNGRRIQRPAIKDFIGKSSPEVSNDKNLQGYLSQHFFENPQTPPGALSITDDNGSVLPYSDYDVTAWTDCLAIYAAFRGIGSLPYVYYDWTDTTINPTLGESFGVIDYVLPAGAKVLIIGDWGTGQSDASALISEMITTYNPACIIHIGDTYYSGLSTECQDNIVQIFLDAFTHANNGVPIPVFSLPGNHEYIGGDITAGIWGTPVPASGPGGGFYSIILPINGAYTSNPLPSATMQAASYFCLRTADGNWQFLGMDTGYYSVPTPDPTIGPPLHSTEVTWHVNKLTDPAFTGNTILLSHHQLYSGDAMINGTTDPGSNYLNDHLLSYFRPYFPKVSAWFWGHEHSLGIFEDGLYGLPIGRLVGNSGYQEADSEAPFTSNNLLNVYASPEVVLDSTVVPYNDPSGTPWYQHSCAVIDFADTAAPAVTYYEYPVWPTGYPQPPLALTPKFTETLAVTNPYFIGWDTPLPNNMVSSTNNFNNIVASGEYVYASANGVVFAMSSTTGAILNGSGNGITLPGETGEIRMVVANGYLYASGSQYVYCLSLDGNTNMIWGNPAKLPKNDIINVAFGDGSLYAGQQGNIYMINPANGSMSSTPTYETGENAEVRLTITGSTVIAGANGDIFFFAGTSSKYTYHYEITIYDNIVNVMVAGNYVYGSTYDPIKGLMCAYSLDGSETYGSQSFSVTIGDEVRMCTDDTNIYAGVYGYVACLAPNTLDYIWGLVDFSENYGLTNVLYSNGYLFASCYGNVYQLNANNGKKSRKLDFAADLGNVPIAFNGAGICAIVTDNVLVNDSYVNQTFITCVSQANLT